jgi:hypothetical protein
MVLYFEMKQRCSLVLCPCTCTQRAAVMLCEIGGHEGSGAVKLGGYIYIFRANVLPPTWPSHNPCLSETLVPVLTKETRSYAGIYLPKDRASHPGRQESSCQRYCFDCSMEQGVLSVCCSKTASLGEAALSGTGANEVWVYMQLYRLYKLTLYTFIYT